MSLQERVKALEAQVALLYKIIGDNRLGVITTNTNTLSPPWTIT